MFCIFVASRTTELIQICIFAICPTFIFQTVYKYPFILLSRMSYAFDQGRVQGLYPFSEKISKDFSRTQDCFFQDSKFYLMPFHSQEFKVSSP